MTNKGGFQKGNPGGLGGARPGAGRKPGSPNKKTQAIVAKAEAGGAMPLDIMLKQMRMYDARAEQLKASKTKLPSDLEAIKEAEALAHERAKDAAPYLHQRLQSTTVSVKPLDLSKLTDEELEQFRALRSKLGGNAG